MLHQKEQKPEGRVMSNQSSSVSLRTLTMEPGNRFNPGSGGDSVVYV